MKKTLLFCVALLLLLCCLSACNDVPNPETVSSDATESESTEAPRPEIIPMPTLSQTEVDMIIDAYAASFEEENGIPASEEYLQNKRDNFACYAKQDGIYAVMAGKTEYTPGTITTQNITADYIFDYWIFISPFPDRNKIMIVKDGRVYGLDKAVINGYIDPYFIQSLHRIYRNANPDLYRDPPDDRYYPETVEAIEKTPLSEAEKLHIISSFIPYYETYYKNSSTNAEPSDALFDEIRENLECYGKKNDVYAVIFDHEHKNDKITSISIDDKYWFHYPDVHEILICYKDKIYHPAEALMRDIIDEDFLISIYHCHRYNNSEFYAFFEY